jgi:hypothetical protein
MRKDLIHQKDITIDSLILNSIPQANSKTQVEKAKKVLLTAKEVESELIKNGSVWMVNGKTSKLVSKNRIALAKKDGFRLCNIKNKNLKP